MWKMPNITEKTACNVYYQARLRASKHNEQLSSREGAADIMSIDRGRLYRIESGLVNPYPEEIHLMTDLYGAPELRNYYCTEVCPLGKDIPKAGVEELDRISLKALSIFRRIDKTENMLLEIAEDGKVTDDEKEDMQQVLKTLVELEGVAQNLKIWVEKNLDMKGGTGNVGITERTGSNQHSDKDICPH